MGKRKGIIIVPRRLKVNIRVCVNIRIIIRFPTVIHKRNLALYKNVSRLTCITGEHLRNAVPCDNTHDRPFFFRHKILRIICFFFDHIAVYVFFYRKDKLRPFYFCGHPGQIGKLLPQIRCGLAAVHSFFPDSMMNPGRIQAI